MTIAAFFLNRRFSDQSFLQTLLRGLGWGSLFLVLSVFFLGGGGESAFAQAKKHYLGGGLAVIPFSAEITGMRDGFEPVSESSDGSAVGINLSYIYAINQSFWIAPSLSLGDGEVEYEEDEGEESEGEEVENGDIGYLSLDVHALYKTPSPFFIGGGLSLVSYEEDADPAVFEEGETLEASGVAPSLRLGVLFDLGPGALMLDAVYRAEVSSDFIVIFPANNFEGELAVTSSQLSVSYLFHF